ncbi:MAG: hypothetical protein N2C12_04375 [Planctomycetales bacterium]
MKSGRRRCGQLLEPNHGGAALPALFNFGRRPEDGHHLAAICGCGPDRLQDRVFITHSDYR